MEEKDEVFRFNYPIKVTLILNDDQVNEDRQWHFTYEGHDEIVKGKTLVFYASTIQIAAMRFKIEEMEDFIIERNKDGK
jgi:hypothetical protein